MADFNLTFDDNAPIDASKLRQLVAYLNEVNTKALQIPDTVGLVNTTLSSKMTSGKKSVTPGAISLKNPVYKQILFVPPLTSNPSSVQVTVEKNSLEGDFVYHIRNPDKSGFEIVFNAVQGQSSTTGTNVGTVTVHYFAMAGTS
jgi:hypothetical protein